MLQAVHPRLLATSHTLDDPGDPAEIVAIDAQDEDRGVSRLPLVRHVAVHSSRTPSRSCEVVLPQPSRADFE